MRKIIRYVLLFFMVVSCGQKKTALLKESQKAQEKLNQEFRDSTSSPLTKEDLKDFEGLDFYPLSVNYIVEARLVKTPEENSFFIPTSDPEVQKEYVKYGEAHFELRGEERSLNLYEPAGGYDDPEYKDYLFIPFTDPTNGEQTYGAGRYLELKKPEGDSFILDFNKAYNPYCAYASGYSCPLPPKANNLTVPIKAGVKKFKDL